VFLAEFTLCGIVYDEVDVYAMRKICLILYLTTPSKLHRYTALWKAAVMACFKVLSEHLPEGLRETTKKGIRPLHSVAKMNNE
jgi:hypothetical protein